MIEYLGNHHRGIWRRKKCQLYMRGLLNIYMKKLRQEFGTSMDKDDFPIDNGLYKG